MPIKPIDLPCDVVLEFVRDMRAFFKEESQLKRDEIASRQCFALRAYQRPRDKKLRLSDVKEMFLQCRSLAQPTKQRARPTSDRTRRIHAAD
jgi:hypothetical protein